MGEKTDQQDFSRGVYMEKDNPDTHGANSGNGGNSLCAILSQTQQTPYKIHQVKSDLRGFFSALLLFQMIEGAMMFTVVMSNERMNLDAPVLRDSVLDSIPKRSVTGKISEVLLFAYQLWFIVFMILHLRRFVLGRRFLTIQCICFTIRMVCIWSDILPRSNYSMECVPKAHSDAEVVERIMLLWSTAGLAMFGGHMCGNYFFSGHALMATIIYNNLAHSMPQKWWFAHKLNVIVALIIPALILMSHNHYTIDIIGSFIVGNWVCKLYLFIAENKDVNTHEWFPVFWLPLLEFMEGDREQVQYQCAGPVELFNFTKFAFASLSVHHGLKSPDGLKEKSNTPGGGCTGVKINSDNSI